ncbi:MAG: hypothetical protein OEO83_17680 [Alphaproteobacteria bacterium]|nr:hypothetical protein [Alphaproteobacteria bacterium]
MVSLFVAVADNAWFAFLAAQRDLDEVNLRQPGGSTNFRALEPDALFSIAAAQGSITAPDLRAKSATVMTQAEISKAQRMARECAGKDYKGCGF